MTRRLRLVALAVTGAILRRARREPVPAVTLWHDDGDECTGFACINPEHDDEPGGGW